MTLRNFTVFCCLFFAGLLIQAQEKNRVVTPHASPAIRFTENRGQWQSQVLFRSALPGGALFIEKNCLTYNFYDRVKLGRIHVGGIAKGEYKDFSIRGHVYKVHFENARPGVHAEKLQQGEDYENFYIGNDKQKWKSNVKNYSQVWLRNIYEGIDYEMLAAVNGAKYNFHVQPGARTADIRLRYEGVDELFIKNGVLHIKTSVNEVIEKKPYAYQIINGVVKEVPCRFDLDGYILRFLFPDGYDHSQQLVIDPVLVFSAQIGSAADNFGMSATFDQAGNLYSAGTVYAPGYPLTTGAYDNTYNNQQEYGTTDVFVTKYNASGNTLLYSTYLGGNGTEVCSSIIVDRNNNLCLYGATGSLNFPVTNGAVSQSFNGGQNIGFINNGSVFHFGTDIYVCKFNTAGTALLASTFFGGSGNDGINYLGATTPITYNLFPAPGTGLTNTCGYDSLLTNYGDQYRGEIQIDSLNNIYICSSTRSGNLPVVNGFDNTLGGVQDAVVAKFNSSLTSLLYSTYLGGSGIDCGNAVFVTPANEIYATGGTVSTDFPGTSGAHSPTYNGGKTDGFVSKITSAGALLRSTYIGTTSYDNSFFVQCDKYGDVYVYGQSLGNMPVQNVPGLPVFSVPNTHQFVSCYDNALVSLKMSTVFGRKTNGLDISPSAFAIDECNGNIYLSGWGGGIITNTVPLSQMPLMSPNQGGTTGYDFYLMALKPHATALLYGSYYGGNQSQEHVDGGTSRFDRKGIIYQSVCAGCGGNQDFPITEGAWPCPGSPSCPTPNHSSNCNNGVFKINFDLQKPVSSVVTTTSSGCVPLTVTLSILQPGTSFKWDLGNGNTTTVIASPVVTFSTPGTHSVSLLVRDTTFCVKEDSTIAYFNVFAAPDPSISLTTTPCKTSVSLNALVPPNSGTLSWHLGNGFTSTLGALSYTYPASGIYTVSLTATNSLSCKGTRTQTVGVLDFEPTAVGGGSLCNGSTMTLRAGGGTSYSWSPASSLTDPAAGETVASPTSNVIYTVVVLNNSFGQTCKEEFTTAVEVKPSPTADFDFTVHPCGGSVVFTDKSKEDIVSWQWQFDAAGTSTVTHPNFYFETGGTKTVNLVSTNVHGCSHLRSKSFDVRDAPVSVSGSVNICLGQETELVASGGFDYRWLPEESIEQPYLPRTTVRPKVTTEYSVIIGTGETNSVTGAPCEFTLTSLVTVSELSKELAISASANPPEIVAGNSTTLIYVGDPGAEVFWYPLNSTTPGTGYTVSASPLKPTTYTVIARRDACQSGLEVLVTVYSNKCLDSEVFVPNTFTPNGDGRNDVFRVRGLSVDEVYFAVYNRWGEMVYETSDKESGWNGRYQDKDAEVGVFGWYLKVKCRNGEETFLKGNVTLIR